MTVPFKLIPKNIWVFRLCYSRQLGGACHGGYCGLKTCPYRSIATTTPGSHSFALY